MAKHYAKLPYPRNLYAAFLSTQDETIGNLLATLDRLKLRKDTIIVFQSDHGHSHEERAHFGGGSSGPYRGAKFSMFEGGLRVPAIISWPGKLPEGAVRDQVSHSCDWLPHPRGIGRCEVAAQGHRRPKPQERDQERRRPHTSQGVALADWTR